MRQIGIPRTFGAGPPKRSCIAITREYGNRVYNKFLMYCVASCQFPDWQRAGKWNIGAKHNLGCLHVSMQAGKQIPFTIISTPQIVLDSVEPGAPTASISIRNARTTMTKQTTKATI